MIPKIIHCCWLSGEKKPELVRRCQASWRKLAPDFEIWEWDRGKIAAELLENPRREPPRFYKAALAARKWAFASDWVRFAAVEKFGGVYLDLDVELIRPIDELLADGRGFFALETERPFRVDPGFGFAAAAGDSSIAALARHYETLEFNPACPLSQNCATVSTALLEPLAAAGKVAPRFLPPPCFNPKGSATGPLRITEQTYAIHHFNMGWTNWKQRLVYKTLPNLGINPGPVIRWIRKLVTSS